MTNLIKTAPPRLITAEQLRVPKHVIERGSEVMRVFDDLDDGVTTHVFFADVMDHPHGWGVFLADVAWAIGLGLAKSYEMPAEQTVAHVRKGFESESDYSAWVRDPSRRGPR